MPPPQCTTGDRRCAAGLGGGSPRCGAAVWGGRPTLADGKGDEDCLRRGEVGEVVKDDRTDMPFDPRTTQCVVGVAFKVRGPRGGESWFLDAASITSARCGGVVEEDVRIARRPAATGPRADPPR
eukprot:gene20376-36483_t